MTTKEQILETLHKVIDPELGHDIVEMGMVRDLTLTPDGAVSFTLGLTITSCPMKDHMAFNARQLLTRLPDVKSVDIRFDSMTDEERKNAFALARPVPPKLVETTRMPSGVMAGMMPCGPPRRPPAGRPNNRGMLGPVTSASKMPTFLPLRASITASSAVSDDLPTPPLPLITATTRPMALKAFNFGGTGRANAKAFLRSSSVMESKRMSTFLTSGSVLSSWRALKAMWSFIGQVGMVNARVKETRPSGVSVRSRTMPIETISCPNSGSMTLRRVSRICSFEVMASPD